MVSWMNGLVQPDVKPDCQDNCISCRGHKGLKANFLNISGQNVRETNMQLCLEISNL